MGTTAISHASQVVPRVKPSIASGFAERQFPLVLFIAAHFLHLTETDVWPAAIALLLLLPPFFKRLWAPAVSLCAVLVLIAFAQAVGGLDVKLLTLAHFLALIVGYFAIRPVADRQVLERAAVAISIANFVLVFTYATPLRDIFYYENIGLYRFRSFYAEPSILAIMTALNMVLIGIRRERWVLVSLNAVVLAATFSGSGILMVLAIVTLNHLTFRGVALALLMVGLLAGAAMGLAGEAFETLVVQRILAGLAGSEGSVTLRFVAPFEVLDWLFHHPWRAVIGMGMGTYPQLIAQHPLEFPSFIAAYDADTRIGELNNLLVSALATGGLALLIPLLGFIARHWRNKEFLAIVLVFPFVSGHMIAAYFFVTVYLGLARFDRADRIG